MPLSPYSPKVFKSTPIKSRVGTNIPGKRESVVSLSSVPSNAGMTSSEYGEKHPVYPFSLNKNRRRPLLSKEELMALYGTGNLLARFERRLRELQEGGSLSQENIEDLLSEINSDDEDEEWNKSMNILKWNKGGGMNIPSIELSMEAEIQYENGVSLYESEMFDDAIACFRYVIDEVQHDKDAWFYLARCLEGKHLRRDARDAYTMAARFGSMEALGILAVWERRCIQNKKTEQEEEEENSTDPDIMLRIKQKKRKNLLMKQFFREKYDKIEAEKDEEKKKRLKEKLQFILREQKANLPEAKEQSQTRFTFGVQKQKEGDFEQAIVYYEEASSMGNTNAFFNLGCMYRDGQGTENSKPDHRIAMLLFQKAASRNHLKAKLNLGVQYQRGDSGEKNIWIAYCNFRDATFNGLPDAQSHYNELLKRIEKKDKYLVDAIDFSQIQMVGYLGNASKENNPESSGVFGDIFLSNYIAHPLKSEKSEKIDRQTQIDKNIKSPIKSEPSSARRKGSIVGLSSPQTSPMIQRIKNGVDRASSSHSIQRKSISRELFKNETQTSNGLKTSQDKKSSEQNLFSINKASIPSKFVTKLIDGSFLNRWDENELKNEILAQTAFISNAKHNHVLRIYSLHFDSSNNRCFVSMDRCLCSLRQYISSFDKFSGDSLNPIIRKHILKLQQSDEIKKKSNLIQILIQIAKAMQYLHSIKIIHRSLTDISILISEDVSQEICVKVSDFGGTTLTNYFDSKYDDKHRRSNIVFFSPEILKGLHSQIPFIYSKASDTYSFGILMYYIWSHGQLPFENIRRESGYFTPESRFYKIQPSHESEFSRIFLETKPSIFNEASELFTSKGGIDEKIIKLIEECCEWDEELRLDDFQTILSRLESIKKEIIQERSE